LKDRAIIKLNIGGISKWCAQGKSQRTIITHKAIFKFFDKSELVYYTNRNKKKKIPQYFLINALLKSYVDDLKYNKNSNENLF